MPTKDINNVEYFYANANGVYESIKEIPEVKDFKVTDYGVKTTLSINDSQTFTVHLSKKDNKFWYWKVFHIPTTKRSRERWQERIKKLTSHTIQKP